MHAQSVITELVAAGHQVHVITPRPGPWEDHRLAASVRLHRLPEIGRGSAAERERRAQASDRAIAEVLHAISGFSNVRRGPQQSGQLKR